MKISPRPSHSEHAEFKTPHPARVCFIVTFYEDFDGAVRASKAFACMSRIFSRDLPVSATSWSFDLLAISRLKATIARTSASADVLVVSANGVKELPPHIAIWVENCMNQSADAEPVLIALHNDGLESDREAAPLCSSLKSIASRKKAAFVSNHDLKNYPDHELGGEPLPSTSAGSIRVLGKTPGPIASHRRGWGIHE